MIGVGLYVKNSVEAVELYQKAFGMELGYHVKNADGAYFHAELYQDGEEALAVVEAAADECPGNQAVQLGVTLANEAEVRRAFELLREGGRVMTPVGPLPWSPCAASVLDRFGVWWYLSMPQHRPPEDFDPNA